MPIRSYTNFDLLLDKHEDGFQARVVNSPAGQAANIFEMPFSDLELENFILKMGQKRGNVRSLNYDTADKLSIEGFGGKLYTSIFAGDINECFRESQGIARSKGQGLRIRLRFSSALKLIDIPWEFLFDPSKRRFLGLSNNTPIIRNLDLTSPVRSSKVDGALRVLVMISSPEDQYKLDVEREWQRIERATAELQASGQLIIDRLPEPSLSALQGALRKNNYHIFHYIGHGGFDKATNDGVLILEDSNKNSHYVSGHYLGTILYDADKLKLAILNACNGGRTSTTDPFAGVGQSLLQQDIPAVVAMQFEITDDAAITFAHEFYAALADGFPIDAAVAEARKTIYAQANEIEWATPVLYMSSQDGNIFTIDKQDRKKADLLAKQQVELKRQAREKAKREQEAQEEAEKQAKLVAEKSADAGLKEGQSHLEQKSQNQLGEAAKQQANVGVNDSKKFLNRSNIAVWGLLGLFVAFLAIIVFPRDSEEAERTKLIKEQRVSNLLAEQQKAQQETAALAARQAAQEQARLEAEKRKTEEMAKAERVAKLAAEKKAQEEAARIAAEKAAEEQAKKLAEEKKAQKEAERIAAEKVAQEEAKQKAEEDKKKKLAQYAPGLVMVPIPAGSFTMGCVSGQDCEDDEKPMHKVSIATFELGKHEVTFRQWDACYEDGGCDHKPDDEWGRNNQPVMRVSWKDAQQYVQWLSNKTGDKYRLPTEAEWEYAARAGSPTAYPWGNSVGQNNAVCDGCGSKWDDKKTAPVGSFATNQFGLYDMHGNVWEWVQDCYHETYKGAPTNGLAWTQNCYKYDGGTIPRVLRGGSWDYLPRYMRSAIRYRSSPTDRYYNYGFRVARTP